MPGTFTITFKNNWKQTWSSSLQRAQIIVGTLLMTIVSCMLPTFFNIIQKKSGPVINDWVLASVTPHNVSWGIFTVLWGWGLYALWKGIEKPSIYITYVWTFLFVCMLRLLTISLIPLDPPTGIVILKDPITGIFYGENTITKDLFFSGHTSVLFLSILCLETKKDKILASIATLTVACLLIVQHAHYTIDIIAAPIVVYPVYRLVKYLLG